MTDRKQLGQMTLDEVANFAGDVTAGSANDQVAKAEFLRRQTLAAEETASFTRRNARYMLLSVVVIAVSSTTSAIFVYLAWAFPHLPH
jgi:hypothetical protein